MGLVKDTNATVPAPIAGLESRSVAISTMPNSQKAMTKDDYWRRREERDMAKEEYFVAKDVRIARSGAWQACAQSLGVLQWSKGASLEEYLAAIDKAADHALGYINKKA